jgi:predicted N-acyltransferase
VATSLEIVDAIRHVEPEAWDELAAGRPFADHRWLGLTEELLLGHEPRYVLVRRDGRLVAAGVCALGRRWQNPALQRRAGWLLRVAPVLRCEIPIALGSGLLVRPGDDPAPLLDGLARLAAREHAAFTRLDHLPPGDAAWPALGRAGYRPVPMWAETRLALGWPSLDRYLASLSSHKRRELNRVRRRAEAEKLVVEPLDPSPECAPRLRALVGQVLARHAAIERYADDLFPRARAALGDDLRLLALRRDGHLVGCGALLRRGDEVSAKWLGLDYAETRGTVAYTRVLIGCVEAAIDLGAAVLRLGATAYQTKQHFGVALEERSAAVTAALPPLTHLAVRALGGRPQMTSAA